MLTVDFNKMGTLMFNISLIAVGIVVVLSIIYFFIRRITSGPKNLKHTVLNDVTAQEVYNKTKNHDEKKYAIKERLELSWQFLYDVTEIVMNKFSTEDIDVVHQTGEILAQTGMKYQHVIELGIRPMHSTSIVKEKEQSKVV